MLQKPTLYLICGLPGSGKSTLASRLSQDKKALRLVPDVWMSLIIGDGYNDAARDAIEKIQWDITKQALSIGASVVLESGFWAKGERQEFRQQAEKLGASVDLYYLDVPLAELKRRIIARNQALPEHTFHVDPNKFDEWVTLFEPPSEDEKPIKLSEIK